MTIRHRLGVLALALALLPVAAHAQPPPPPGATPTDLINKIQVLLDLLRITAEPPAAPVGPAIPTAAALDAALATAAPGATLILSNALVYRPGLTITRPVTLRAELVPEGRMTLTPVLPRFLGGLTVTSDDVTLVGLDVRNATYPNATIVTLDGARIRVDRLRVLGDSQTGAKRGIAAFPRGGGTVTTPAPLANWSTITRSYVADCWRPSPGDDTQAFAMWEGSGLVVEDNYLEAGSETVLIGGADAKTADAMPADIILRGNTITAKLAWMGKAIGVKTRLEFKTGRRFLVEGNTIENVWMQGQGGYLLSLTVRNQEGTAPWSTIEDGIIRGNRFAHGAGAINLLSSDNEHPSGTLARVTLTGNTWTDIDADKYEHGNSKLIQIQGGAIDLTIDGDTFAGAHVSSVIYFAGSLPLPNFRVTHVTFPPSEYGVFGVDVSTGVNPATGLPRAWERWTRGASVFAGNTVTP